MHIFFPMLLPIRNRPIRHPKTTRPSGISIIFGVRNLLRQPPNYSVGAAKSSKKEDSTALTKTYVKWNDTFGITFGQPIQLYNSHYGGSYVHVNIWATQNIA